MPGIGTFRHLKCGEPTQAKETYYCWQQRPIKRDLLQKVPIKRDLVLLGAKETFYYWQLKGLVASSSRSLLLFNRSISLRSLFDTSGSLRHAWWQQTEFET